MYSFAAVPLLALRLCLQVCLWPRPTTEREEQAADNMTAHSTFQTRGCSLCLGFEQVQRGGSQGLLSIRCGDQSDGVAIFGQLGSELLMYSTSGHDGGNRAARVTRETFGQAVSLNEVAAKSKRGSSSVPV